MNRTLYEYENQDLSDYTTIERETFKKAVRLNDSLIDLKTMIEELNYEWDDFISFIEDEKVSKYCEFKGEETVDFDDELLNAIVLTLKESLVNANRALNYNSKKIKINRAVEG